VDFNVGSFSTRTEQAFGGEIIARLLGFLRPLESWGNDEMLRVCVSNADAVLNMSEDAEYGKLVSIFCSSVFQVGDCSENLRSVRKKMETLLCTAGGTASHHHVSEAGTVCGRCGGCVKKNDKAVLNVFVLN